jgi:GWxTD domain-containing protein
MKRIHADIRGLTVLAVLALLWLGIPTGYAQEDVARQHIEKGVGLAAAGDTAAALAELQKAVDAAPEMAEAHFQLGRLLARHASGNEFDFRERLAAQRELLLAIDLDPSNPEYLAEFGELRIKQHRQVEGALILNRARSMAEREGFEGDSVLADIEFGLGYRKELEYERFRDRHHTPMLGTPISTEAYTMSGNAYAGIWASRYVEWYLEMAQPIPGSGEETRDEALAHYRKALEHNLKHYYAAKRMLALLLEDGRVTDYVIAAERFVRDHPDRPDVLLYLGLGLHLAAYEERADSSFHAALAGMREEDKAPFYDLSPVLRRGPAAEYSRLDKDTQGRYDDLFWRMTDPLYLTDANERRLEHWARIAYADLRFTEPSAGLRGWQTDRGVTFIRYGPPHRVARFAANVQGGANSTIVWMYEDGPVFMFRQTPGFLQAQFAGDYQFVADEYRHARPSDYSNIPSLPMLLDLPFQIARFRGDSERDIAVEFHAELPLEAMAEDLDLAETELETGLFVMNFAADRITGDTVSEIVQWADASSINTLRSWRLHLPAAGRLMAAVEARDATTGRAAAARDTFVAEFFTEDTLSISDILLADALRPLTEEPVRRTDFDIAANPSRAYSPDQPVVIYYELYGLEQDSERFASYDVSLAVKMTALNREGSALGGDSNPLAVIGDLADAWGFTPVGSDRLELQFSRELQMAGRDRATEYHSLDLQKAPAGQYEITLRVFDKLGQQLARRTRDFWVSREE